MHIYIKFVNLWFQYVVKKGIGGIGLGAAEALYLASCYAFDFDRVPINPRVVIGLNGWLPSWR